MKDRMLGVYVGVAVDPEFDVEKWFAKAAAAGYTSISVFLTTAFFGKMWPFGNPEYYEHFKRLLRASRDYKIRLHLCFVDQFHDKKDSPVDPFRKGLGLGDAWDEETLYSSITFA